MQCGNIDAYSSKISSISCAIISIFLTDHTYTLRAHVEQSFCHKDSICIVAIINGTLSEVYYNTVPFFLSALIEPLIILPINHIGF